MVSTAQEFGKRREDGRFDGYGVNCEAVPCLPARIACDCLADPRRVPYLLIWKHRQSGAIVEVARLASPHPAHDWLQIGWTEVKRGDGSKVRIRLSQTAYKPMLICNSCQKPRLALYAWKTNEGPRNLSPAQWPCKSCAGLSYASEGRALFINPVFPELRPFWKLLRKPRPEPWEPLVFTSPKAAVDAGICSKKG